MKKPLLTKDQLILLKYNNIPSGKYKTNIRFKFNSNLKYFDKEILQIFLYVENWRRIVEK